MARFSEASGRGEPSGSEVPDSGCLRFGVRSYLHQFYEERDPEDRGIESFGEGDMFFVDANAASFNRGLHLSAAAGTGLSCFGAALTAATGIGILILAGKGSKRWKQTGFREAVAKPAGKEQGKVPATLFAEVEPVQSAS
ncbi:hypothetical protein EYF80_048613 [Liparis tanakae]|uniref:Uncharacterized protein n=1 Tax=Liparis tanakae TaxID=230148 RepID=A0A4Z2FJU8_9TELE|nr:hypothetical protein EYF80_048613 [Liparis tanakae]